MKINLFIYSLLLFRLQPTLLALIGDHNYVGNLFGEVSKLLNVLGVFCKRYDLLCENKMRLKEALDSGKIESGRRLNKEFAPIEVGDTH